VRPVVIDPDRPGQGTSTGSFASISAFGKDPAAWFQLACAGMSGWPRFAGRIGGDVGLRRAGEVRFTSDPEEGRRLTRQVADARGRGYSIRMVDADEVARLLPEARVGRVAAACFAPNDGQVQPPLVLAACRAELEAAGARFVGGRARIHLDDDGVRVEVGTEVLRPRTTVLAAGAAPRCCGPGRPCWPPAPRPSTSPPRLAWRSRPCPARACWPRPGRWPR